jgi:hypothetical protein
VKGTTSHYGAVTIQKMIFLGDRKEKWVIRSEASRVMEMDVRRTFNDLKAYYASRI